MGYTKNKPAKLKFSVEKLQAFVHLGHGEKERQNKQEISISFAVEFAPPPAATVSDQLEDTVCYDTLCKEILNFLEPRTYHMVEKLSHDVYQLLQKHLPENSELKLKVHKLNPMVKNLQGGVSCTLD